jgi:hypothetical protein
MDDGDFALAALTVLRSCDAPTLVTWMPPFPGSQASHRRDEAGRGGGEGRLIIGADMRGAARTRPDEAYAAALVICTALAIASAPWALMLSVFP